MRTHLLSKLSIITFVLFLLVSVGVNLYIVHQGPLNAYTAPSPLSHLTIVFPKASELPRWPTLPDELDDEFISELGKPRFSSKTTYRTFQHRRIYWADPEKHFTHNDHMLEEYRLGVPLSARSMKQLWQTGPTEMHPIWPSDSEFLLAYTYHPLGLIVNPVVYAAPSWGVLMIVVYGATHKRRRRIANGLCLECGYDIQELPICPECGNATNAEHPTPQP